MEETVARKGRRRFIKWALGIGAVAVVSGYVANNLFAARRKSTAALLPPGQYLAGSMTVLEEEPIPQIGKDAWSMTVYGEVSNMLTLDYASFLKLGTISSVSDFSCVTGWTVLTQNWEGVRFRTLMDRAGVIPGTKFATIECVSGYTTQLSIADLSLDDVLLAYRLNGEDLPAEHGGPVRLVVPEKYGYKSAKWISKIKFTNTLELGYWESRGYSNSADIQKDDRYASPG